eukprot:1851584-Karenia_brevis.AAC.1
MYEHQGLAWVVGAQAIIRLYRRCLEARETPQGLKHKQKVLTQAKDMADTYVETKIVIDARFAATICSALKHLTNMGIPALNRMQDKLAQAITEAVRREAKHNRDGYAEWVERILNQRE